MARGSGLLSFLLEGEEGGFQKAHALALAVAFDPPRVADPAITAAAGEEASLRGRLSAYPVERFLCVGVDACVSIGGAFEVARTVHREQEDETGNRHAVGG